MQEEIISEPQDETVNIGQPLLQWEVDEYAKHERSRAWYIMASGIGILLILYAIATANYLFAVIILMMGVILFVSMLNDPERISVVITTTGIVVGDMYYDYQSIRDFSIAYDPPHIKILYLDFFEFWHPMISVPLELIDPNVVRKQLLSFCPENLDRTEENLTDLVKRVYKV